MGLDGTTPTLSGPGGTLSGVLYSDAPGHQIAVFDFNSINLGSGQSLEVSSPPDTLLPTPPLALLSRSETHQRDDRRQCPSALYTPAFFPRWPWAGSVATVVPCGGGGFKTPLLAAGPAAAVADSAATVVPAVPLAIGPSPPLA